MDMLVTTRLHGAVLALKNGVPVLAIDPESGGAKIQRQMKTIGWPIVFTVDRLTDEELRNALEYCLTEEARDLARACGLRSAHEVASIGEEFIAALSNPQELNAKHRRRLALMQNQPKTGLSQKPVTKGMLQRMTDIITRLGSSGAQHS
jgi:polysaccharide pyruvyl transferase WcaK-like protein